MRYENGKFVTDEPKKKARKKPAANKAAAKKAPAKPAAAKKAPAKPAADADGEANTED